MTEPFMQNRTWLNQNHEIFVSQLAQLVGIQSVSTDGLHEKELKKSAELVAEQMRWAGLTNVELLVSGDSYPYVYGEWLAAPGKPTVFLYAHHDVQPVQRADVEQGRWHSPPWELTEREGRLYGRGSADDKGAITAQLAAIASFLRTGDKKLPVNVKMLVEGEEEVGSTNLSAFFKKYADKIAADAIVVCDTENVATGLPSLTYSLRGVVTLRVDVETAHNANHSGMSGGSLADAALALNVLLARLFWDKGAVPVEGFYDGVRPLTAAERSSLASLPCNETVWRTDCGVLPGVRLAVEGRTHVLEQTWRKPAVTIIAQEASSFREASNQVLPRASALVSCRIVPDQDPQQVFEALKRTLTKDPPWGAQVTVEPKGDFVKWWLTDPQGPIFAAALEALEAGFGKKPVAIGCGGTIGFVGPLSDLLGGVPALLFGIEDPKSNAHAPNESLHVDDWRRLMASLAEFFERLGRKK